MRPYSSNYWKCDLFVVNPVVKNATPSSGTSPLAYPIRKYPPPPRGVMSSIWIQWTESWYCSWTIFLHNLTSNLVGNNIAFDEEERVVFLSFFPRAISMTSRFGCHHGISGMDLIFFGREIGIYFMSPMKHQLNAVKFSSAWAVSFIFCTGVWL